MSDNFRTYAHLIVTAHVFALNWPKLFDFMGFFLLYPVPSQSLSQKISLIPGFLLYPVLLYPVSFMCCNILLSTGVQKKSLISGFLLYPILLYPVSTVLLAVCMTH